MTKNLSYPLLTESPGKVCGSYFNVASGQTTHITMCSFSTPFKVIMKKKRNCVVLVVDTKTDTQTHRSIHKHTYHAHCTSPCAGSPLRLRLSRKKEKKKLLGSGGRHQDRHTKEVYTNTTQTTHVTMCRFSRSPLRLRLSRKQIEKQWSRGSVG